MKRFLTKLALFALLAFALDKAFLLVESYLPGKQYDKRLEEVLNGNTPYDLSVFGSSRGARNINALQLEEQLGVSCYNFSFPGSDIDFQEFLLRAYLQAGGPKPRVLLLVMDDPEELIPTPVLNFRFDRLYPLTKFKYVRNEMADRGVKSRVFNELWVSYRMNAHLLKNLRGPVITDDNTIKGNGDMPRERRRPERFFTSGYYQTKHRYLPRFDKKEKAEKLQSFVSIAKEAGIIPVIIFTPNYRTPTPGFRSHILDLVGENTEHFIPDEENPTYRDIMCFTDISHLTAEGAQSFTQELGEWIKRNPRLVKALDL